MKKTIIWGLSILVLVGAIWSYKLIWGKPFNIDHFFDRALLKTSFQEPELLSRIGLLDNTMLDFHSDKLGDASPEHSQKMMALTEEQLEMLHRYDRSKLEGQQALSYDIFEWYLQNELDKKPWLFHDYPVNPTFGLQSLLPTFMDQYHRIEDEESSRNYISRLEAFNKKFEQLSESVIYRAEQGIVPPRFVYENVIKNLKEFTAHEPVENPLYITFKEKTSEVESLDDKLVTELEKEAATAIRDSVYAGYRTLSQTLEQLLDQTRTTDGVWALPNGEDYYEHTIKYHTTLSLKPEEVHQLGLKEVERLEQQLVERFSEIGISGDTIDDLFNQLNEREGTFYPEADSSYDQIITDFTSIIDTLYDFSKPFFSQTPSADLVVKRVPEFSEEGVPFAYYNIPSLDGGTPGTFFINLRKIDKIPKYGMKTLAAHEGVPGHHFQLALQQEIEDVPVMRKIIPFTAYIEGWGLYAEWLMAEAGLYENDPFSDIGRLQGEIFRAARLVVDSGIHYKKWTREEAIDYLIEKTGMPDGDMESEVNRYIVMPGQALAYKVGMMHIRDLRKKAEQALGSDFSLTEFHEIILMNGSMPLKVLTTVVESYIEEKQSA